jgi:hypothetical protein
MRVIAATNVHPAKTNQIGGTKMNMNTQPNKTLFEKNRLLRQSKGANIFLVVILIIVVTMTVVIGVQAIESVGEGGSGDAVLMVPRNYATIQQAINAAKPGNIIQVSPGIYNENLTLDKPVSLIAETFDETNPANNETIIDAGGTGTAILIPPGLTQMPTIRGFVIRNCSDGILASSRFIAEFNYIHSAGNLVSYQSGGGGFNRNNVYFGAHANAIRMDHTTVPLIIENNRIMYNGKAGIEISLQNTSVPPAVVEIDIWNNMILGNTEDGIQFVDHQGEPQDTNRRFVIAGNLIANNRKAGLGLMPNANAVEDYSGADTSEAVRVFNNTFYGNDYGISGGDNLVAFNNIIANSLTRGTWRIQSNPDVNVQVSLGRSQFDNSVVAYSLYHNNRLDTDQTTIGTGVIMGVDPLFESEPNSGPDGTWATVDDDFSGLVLRSDSPAIDKGVTQYKANNGELVPPTPISGYTGAAPDLGWREFGAPIFSTSTPTSISSPTSPATEILETLTSAPTQTSAPGSPIPPTVTSIAGSPAPLPTSTPISGTPTTAVTQTAILTVTPQLGVLSIDPISAQADATLTMTITGFGFQNGATVTFEGGQGAAQEILALQVVSDTTIYVTMTARNNGAFGAQVWDIRVTNPDLSTAVLLDAFTVNPAP